MAVKLLQLHRGYEMLAGLEAEGLGLAQAGRGSVQVRRGELWAGFARARIVQEAQRVTILHVGAGQQQ